MSQTARSKKATLMPFLQQLCSITITDFAIFNLYLYLYFDIICANIYNNWLTWPGIAKWKRLKAEQTEQLVSSNFIFIKNCNITRTEQKLSKKRMASQKTEQTEQLVSTNFIFIKNCNITRTDQKLSENIARGTTDPEIESVHLSNLLNDSIR